MHDNRTGKAVTLLNALFDRIHSFEGEKGWWFYRARILNNRINEIVYSL